MTKSVLKAILVLIANKNHNVKTVQWPIFAPENVLVLPDGVDQPVLFLVGPSMHLNFVKRATAPTTQVAIIKQENVRVLPVSFVF